MIYAGKETAKEKNRTLSASELDWIIYHLQQMITKGFRGKRALQSLNQSDYVIDALFLANRSVAG